MFGLAKVVAAAAPPMRPAFTKVRRFMLSAPLARGLGPVGPGRHPVRCIMYAIDMPCRCGSKYRRPQPIHGHFWSIAVRIAAYLARSKRTHDCLLRAGSQSENGMF